MSSTSSSSKRSSSSSNSRSQSASPWGIYVVYVLCVSVVPCLVVS